VHRAVGGQRGRNTTVIAAISDQCGILYHEIHFGSVTKEVVSDFIASLSAIIGDARRTLVLDNAPVHNGITGLSRISFLIPPSMVSLLEPTGNRFSVFKTHLKQYRHRGAPRCNAARARQQGVTLTMLRENILHGGAEFATSRVNSTFSFEEPYPCQLILGSVY